MAITSVSDFSLFINQQIQAQEKIERCLWKLEALLAVAMRTEDFYKLPQSRLHNYFSIVDDLVDEVAEVNQVVLDELLKQKRWN